MTHLKRFAGVIRLRVQQAIRRQGLCPPLTTADAFELLRSWLGYMPTRRRLDKALAGGRVHVGTAEFRYAWSLEAVVDFALELERLRAWAVGWHDTKKSPWELDAEAEQVKGLARLEAAELPELLDALVEARDALRIHALAGLICARLPEGVPDEVFHLLSDLRRTDSFASRCALAEMILDLVTQENAPHAG